MDLDRPVLSSLAGRSSVYRRIPRQVLSAAFDVDQGTLEKLGRDGDVILPPPTHVRRATRSGELRRRSSQGEDEERWDRRRSSRGEDEDQERRRRYRSSQDEDEDRWDRRRSSRDDAEARRERGRFSGHNNIDSVEQILARVL
mgnify:CR=1 FL=1